MPFVFFEHSGQVNRDIRASTARSPAWLVSRRACSHPRKKFRCVVFPVLAEFDGFARPALALAGVEPDIGHELFGPLEAAHVTNNGQGAKALMRPTPSTFIKRSIMGADAYKVHIVNIITIASVINWGTFKDLEDERCNKRLVSV